MQIQGAKKTAPSPFSRSRRSEPLDLAEYWHSLLQRAYYTNIAQLMQWFWPNISLSNRKKVEKKHGFLAGIAVKSCRRGGDSLFIPRRQPQISKLKCDTDWFPILLHCAKWVLLTMSPPERPVWRQRTRPRPCYRRQPVSAHSCL
jgi:hypothetical protein